MAAPANRAVLAPGLELRGRALDDFLLELAEAITGDYVMIASEVNTVIRTLRDNGIVVTSLHNHLLDEEPRLFFMHFWANDDALKLARGLRAALDATNSRRGSR
jgi:hypothetical protein